MEEQNPKQTKAIFLGGAALLLAVFVMIRFSGTFYAETANISITVAIIFGFTAGLFLSRRFAAIRAYFFIFCLIAAGLFVAFAAPQGAPPILFILTFLSGLAFGYIERRKAKRTEFGSAEWATIEHLQENGLIGDKGLMLGFFPTETGLKPLHYEGDRHALVVSPTRGGKGTNFIIPNLLIAKNSCVIIDPKGENAIITAHRRGQGNESGKIKGMGRCQGLGQKVHVVDPWGITGFKSSRFNPLDWLQPDDIDLNENAMILADSMITPSASSQEPFWDNEAKALLMGILLYVAIVEDEENRHLGRVRDIISFDKDDLNDILTEMSESENIVVKSAGTRTLSKEERIRSSVLASLQAHTHFLDSPRMRENLIVSDFGFEDLKYEPTTIYLVLPADRLDTFGRWLRLMIQQALTINARNIEKKPERPILFFLDEMANLGRLSMVEKAYSLMSGFGIQLLGIVQDVGQLERIYGKGWQTFIGNSGAIQYYGSRDYQTADYFSKLCGVTTIEKFSFSESIARAISNASGNQGGTSSTTETSSYTKDVAQRQLAYADELMSLKNDRQIVFIENYNPISGIKVPWFDNDNIKGLGVNLHQLNAPPLPEIQHQETEPLQNTEPIQEAPNKENFLAEKVVQLAKNVETTVKSEEFKDRIDKTKGQIIKKGNALLDKAKAIKQERAEKKERENPAPPPADGPPLKEVWDQITNPLDFILELEQEGFVFCMHNGILSVVHTNSNIIGLAQNTGYSEEEVREKLSLNINDLPKASEVIKEKAEQTKPPLKDKWDSYNQGIDFMMNMEQDGYIFAKHNNMLCIVTPQKQVGLLDKATGATEREIRKKLSIDIKGLPEAAQVVNEMKSQKA